MIRETPSAPRIGAAAKEKERSQPWKIEKRSSPEILGHFNFNR